MKVTSRSVLLRNGIDTDKSRCCTSLLRSDSLLEQPVWGRLRGLINYWQEHRMQLTIEASHHAGTLHVEAIVVAEIELK